MARRYSSVWQPKHYGKKKPLPPIQIGDKFHRLTVIEIRLKKDFGNTREIVCRCECSALVTTSPQSLRKGFVIACEADMVLERKYAKEIAITKAVERQCSPHVDSSELPQRPKWEFAGAEDELIASQEKENDSIAS